MTPSCEPITNCIYADNLLIFGKAATLEANTIMNALIAFSDVSGQQIGPTKSSIWFSRPTGDMQREAVSRIFQVQQTAISCTYLGAPIATTAGAFDFLIEAISRRLSSWKSKVLTQAGRLVLIKSVLQSIPIYFMATFKIPQKVINKISSLARRFYWGKVDKSRYMSLLAWDKLVKPILMGGLGLRDMAVMNKALLLKMLWRLASGSDALWARQVRAKCLPNSEL